MRAAWATLGVVATLALGTGIASASEPASRVHAVHVEAKATEPAASGAARATAPTSTDPAIWAFEAPMLGIPVAGGSVTSRAPVRLAVNDNSQTPTQLWCTDPAYRWQAAGVPNRTDTSWAYPQGYWADAGSLPRWYPQEGAAISIHIVRPRADSYTVDLADYLCPGWSLAGPVYPVGGNPTTLVGAAGVPGYGTAQTVGSLNGQVTLRDITTALPQRAQTSVTGTFWALTTDGRQVAINYSVQWAS